MTHERYYCEDEVERLIQNLAQWGGDGAGVRSSPTILQRLLAEFNKGSGPVVTIGVDAGYTQAALLVIGPKLGDALAEYHLSPYPIYHQAAQLRITKPTYRRRLETGHIDFMAAYHAARRASKL